MVEHRMSREQRRGTCFYIKNWELSAGVNKIKFSGIGVQGGDGFSLAKLWHFSLVELVTGREENLPSTCRGNRGSFLFVVK